MASISSGDRIMEGQNRVKNHEETKDRQQTTEFPLSCLHVFACMILSSDDSVSLSLVLTSRVRISAFGFRPLTRTALSVSVHDRQEPTLSLPQPLERRAATHMDRAGLGR